MRKYISFFRGIGTGLPEIQLSDYSETSATLSHYPNHHNYTPTETIIRYFRADPAMLLVILLLHLYLVKEILCRDMMEERKISI